MPGEVQDEFIYPFPNFEIIRNGWKKIKAMENILAIVPYVHSGGKAFSG